MFIFTSIFTTLLLVSQVVSQDSCFAGSREMDAQCSTYCYQVVKPLLQYTNSAQSKTEQFADLQSKIKDQAATIVNLNLQLTMQAELLTSCKSNADNQQKLIAQNEQRLANLRSDNRSKDSTSCRHVLKANGVLENKPDLAKIDDCNWIVIQRRFDGKVTFNRYWSEYKDGFGDVHGEFFIGLESIHRLTSSQPHELLIYFVNRANETQYARYSSFIIGSEDEGYILKALGSHSGDAKDLLTAHVNQKFSTPDRDNDNLPYVSCGRLHSSGWWFTNCYKCNLNGLYQCEPKEHKIPGCISWDEWKSNPLKSSLMLIRPKLI